MGLISLPLSRVIRDKGCKEEHRGKARQPLIDPKLACSFPQAVVYANRSDCGRQEKRKKWWVLYTNVSTVGIRMTLEGEKVYSAPPRGDQIKG